MTIERAVMHTAPGAAAKVSGLGASSAPFAAGEASAWGWG